MITRSEIIENIQSLIKKTDLLVNKAQLWKEINHQLKEIKDKIKGES